MSATALRRIFCNWYTKRLQISDLNGGEFILPAFNKYETIPFEIVIVEPDLAATGLLKWRRVDINNLSLSVAINQTFDTAAPIAYQTTWAKDESFNVFSGELAINTAGVNTYLGSEDSRPAYLELEIQEGTARNKIYTATITLQNAVTQISSIAPTPADEYYTKAQLEQQFIKKVMGAGETITMQSPNGLVQRVLGVGDDSLPIDQQFPA